MTDFVKYVIEGVPLGCVFALVAIGLVLTYKTSGVFNLAFGAQAYVAAVLFYELRVRNEWPTPAAFVVVVLIASPLMGLVLELAIFRHLRAASADRQAGLVARAPGRRAPVRRDPAGDRPDVRGEGRLVERRRAVPLRRLRARRQGDGRHREHGRGGRPPRDPVPLRPDRPPDAGRRRESAHDRAGGRRRRPGVRLRLDALQPLRRSRGGAARSALRVARAAELHDAAGGRDRGGRVRPAHQHPARARRRDPARRGAGAPRRVPAACERARPEPPAVAAVRGAVPPAALLARTSDREREQGPVERGGPAADGAGRGEPWAVPHGRDAASSGWCSSASCSCSR